MWSMSRSTRTNSSTHAWRRCSNQWIRAEVILPRVRETAGTGHEEITMTTYAMGIDFGSTTAKTIILDGDGVVVASCIESMGAVSDEGVKASIAGALRQVGITQQDVGFTVTTGYGRRMLDVSQKSYTETTCHARGAVALVPDARLVIDIGGQDSKVIAVDANGLVETFSLNDRCAAGTGKFLEVLARAVDIKLPEMGPMAMQASKSLKIFSMCDT